MVFLERVLLLIPIILATWEAETERLTANQGKKLMRTSSQPIKAGHGSILLKSINRRILVQASLGINIRPYSKNN
jgi:hypothetical protein